MAQKKPSQNGEHGKPGEKRRPIVELQLEHVFPDGDNGKFSNHQIVQFDGHDFYLTFFEIPPPVALGEPNERKEKLLKLGSVEAKCVARVVISASRIGEFAEAIVTNIRKNQPSAVAGLIKSLGSEEE